MRKFFLLSIITLFTGQIYGQKPLPGGYSSLNEFKSKKPKYSDSFIINRRTQGDIIMWGGNDYKIESTDKLITNSIIKDEIWGIYKDDTLYLNGKPITGLMWYSKVEVLGKYGFLHPSFPIKPKIQKEFGLNDPQYGYLFGPVGGGIQGGKMAVKRIPLIYNMETGEKQLLTDKNIANLLVKYPNLKAEYDKESDKKNEKVLLKYLKKINEQ